MKFEETKQEKYIDMGYEVEDKIASNDIEMHFIELPKFLRKRPDYNNKLEQWLSLITGKGEETKMAMRKNEKIEKAYREIERLSEDTAERELYELRMKAIRDEKNMYTSGVEDGVAQGKLEIAKNMLKEKIDIEVIKRVTGLTEEEIQKLQ